MSRPDLGLVGTSRDGEALLKDAAGAFDLETALDVGVLIRRKIIGQWLYAASPAAFDAGLDAVEAAAVDRLHAWLLGSNPFLKHPIARASARPRVTVRAAEVLLRELVHQGRVGALGLLTNTYEPYLALYALDDGSELMAQMDVMEGRLHNRGHVRSVDLPDPRRPREGNAWRSLILRHGEFLGLGRLDNSSLIPWETNAP
jgi:hypothetical protein